MESRWRSWHSWRLVIALALVLALAVVAAAGVRGRGRDRALEEFGGQELTDAGRSMLDPSCVVAAADDEEGVPFAFSEVLRKHPTDATKCIVPGAGFGLLANAGSCDAATQDASASRRHRPRIPPSDASAEPASQPVAPATRWSNPLSSPGSGITLDGLKPVSWGLACVASFRPGMKRAELQALDGRLYEAAVGARGGAGAYLHDASGVGTLRANMPPKAHGAAAQAPDLAGADGSAAEAAAAEASALCVTAAVADGTYVLGSAPCDAESQAQAFAATPLGAGGSSLESRAYPGKCLRYDAPYLVLGDCVAAGSSPAEDEPLAFWAGTDGRTNLEAAPAGTACFALTGEGLVTSASVGQCSGPLVPLAFAPIGEGLGALRKKEQEAQAAEKAHPGSAVSTKMRQPVASVVPATCPQGDSGVIACGSFGQTSQRNRPQMQVQDGRLRYVVLSDPGFLTNDHMPLGCLKGGGLTLVAVVRFPIEIGGRSDGAWVDFKGQGTGADDQGSLTISAAGSSLSVRVTTSPGYTPLWSATLPGAVDEDWAVLAIRLTQLSDVGGVGGGQVHAEAVQLKPKPVREQKKLVAAAAAAAEQGAQASAEDLLDLKVLASDVVDGWISDQTWNTNTLGGGPGAAGRTSHVVALAIWDMAVPDDYIRRVATFSAGPSLVVQP